MGIPSVNLNDNDLSFHVCKLVFPLSNTVVVPEVFPDEVLSSSGALDRIRRFRGVTEVAHVLDHLETCEISKKPMLEEPYVIFRPAPEWASYLESKTKQFSAEKLISCMIKQIDDIKVYILPRKGVNLKLRRGAGGRIRMLKGPIDFLAAVERAEAFIGAGGTMTREAALLGIPSISTFPGEREPCVTQFLIEKGLVIRLKSPKKVVEAVINFIRDEGIRKELKIRSKSFLRESEDPSEVLWEEIRRLCS